MLQDPLHGLAVVGAVRRHGLLRLRRSLAGALLLTASLVPLTLRRIAAARLLALVLPRPLATLTLLTGPRRLHLATVAAIAALTGPSALLLAALLSLRLSAGAVLAPRLLLLTGLIASLALLAVLGLPALGRPLLFALLGLTLLLALARIGLPLGRRLLPLLTALAASALLLPPLILRRLLATLLRLRLRTAGVAPAVFRIAVLRTARLPFSVLGSAVLRRAVLGRPIRARIALPTFLRLPLAFAIGHFFAIRRWRLPRRRTGIDHEPLPFGVGDIWLDRTVVLHDSPVFERSAQSSPEVGGHQRRRTTKRLACPHEQLRPRPLGSGGDPGLDGDTRESEVGIGGPHPHGQRRVGRHPQHLLGRLLDRHLGGEIGDHVDPVFHLVEDGGLTTCKRSGLRLKHQPVARVLRRVPFG